jgi:hypothetical protein
MESMHRSTGVLVVLCLIYSGVVARAQSGPPSNADLLKAVQACESSSYNTSGVTLPDPQLDQKPTFTTAQKDLIQACQSAGIFPTPPHGGHGPAGGPPPGEGAQAGGPPPTEGSN